MLSAGKHVQLKIGEVQIENNSNERLLGVTVDANLSFEKLIKQISAKARANLKALARIANIKKKKVLMKAFFMAQFSYCSLIWMFNSRKLNNKINNFYELSLRIVYGDNTSSFEELSETDNSVSVHHQNIPVLATKLHKIVNGISPEIKKEYFPFNEKTFYNTRNKRMFHLKSIKSVAFGSEALSHLVPKIWELASVKIEDVDSVTSFKRAIKKWKPINSPCHLCRRYVFQVGFV